MEWNSKCTRFHGRSLSNHHTSVKQKTRKILYVFFYAVKRFRAKHKKNFSDRIKSLTSRPFRKLNQTDRRTDSTQSLSGVRQSKAWNPKNGGISDSHKLTGELSWLLTHASVIKQVLRWEHGSVTSRPFRKSLLTYRPTDRPTEGHAGSRGKATLPL